MLIQEYGNNNDINTWPHSLWRIIAFASSHDSSANIDGMSWGYLLTYCSPQPQSRVLPLPKVSLTARVPVHHHLNLTQSDTVWLGMFWFRSHIASLQYYSPGLMAHYGFLELSKVTRCFGYIRWVWNYMAFCSCKKKEVYLLAGSHRANSPFGGQVNKFTNTFWYNCEPGNKTNQHLFILCGQVYCSFQHSPHLLTDWPKRCIWSNFEPMLTQNTNQLLSRRISVN